MIQRIFTAYRFELAKAAHRKSTYAGPVLIVALVVVLWFTANFGGLNRGGFDFIAFATPLTLNLLGLLLVLAFGAGLVAPELGSGTAGLVLVRPIARHEFLAGKMLLGMTYALALSMLTAATSWTLPFCFGSLSGVSYGGEVVYAGTEMLWTYLLGMLLGLAPLFAASAYATMISALTRSGGRATAIAIVGWLMTDALKDPLRIAPYLFSSYLEQPWSVFADRCDLIETDWFPMTYYCLGTSAAAILICCAIAFAAFARRDLAV